MKLSDLLFEVTRQKKEYFKQNISQLTQDKDFSYKQLRYNLDDKKYQDWIKKGAEELFPNFFIHFTNHEGELTPYLGAKWDTPYGIYGYPINGQQVINQAYGGRLSYGASFKFVKFFRLKNYDKLLIMDDYTIENYYEDKQKLMSIFGNDESIKDILEEYENSYNKEYDNSESYYDDEDSNISNPAQILVYGLNQYFKNKNIENYIKKKEQRATKKDINYINLNSHIFALSKTLETLGYVGLCDLGNKFIGREYSQAVIFSSKYIQVLGEVKNPFINTDSQEYGKVDNRFLKDNKPKADYYKKIIDLYKNILKNESGILNGEAFNIKVTNENVILNVKIDLSDMDIKSENEKNIIIKTINKLFNSSKDVYGNSTFNPNQMLGKFLNKLYQHKRIYYLLNTDPKIENFDQNNLTYDIIFTYRN